MVSSGDVDSLVNHLFTLSHRLPRNSRGAFESSVYVWLENPGEVYCITGIIRLLERHYNERHIAMKVAMALTLAGNDYVPKYHGFSHEKVLKTYLENEEARKTLFDLSFDEGGNCVSAKVDPDAYVNFIKDLY